MSLGAVTTILAYTSGGSDVPFENALTVAWWTGGVAGLIVGALFTNRASGKTALAASTVALPVGFMATVLLHVAGLLGTD